MLKVGLSLFLGFLAGAAVMNVKPEEISVAVCGDIIEEKKGLDGISAQKSKNQKIYVATPRELVALMSEEGRLVATSDPKVQMVMRVQNICMITTKVNMKTYLAPFSRWKDVSFTGFRQNAQAEFFTDAHINQILEETKKFQQENTSIFWKWCL